MEWTKIDKDNLPDYDNQVVLYFTGVKDGAAMVLGKRVHTDKNGEHYLVVLPNAGTEKRSGATHYLTLEAPKS